MTALGDEDVGGLDIAMNDPRRVRRTEGVSDFDVKRQQHIDFQRTSSNAVLQHHAVQKFHGDERLPFVFPDLMDGADVGMVQGRSCPGFAPETFERLRVTSNVLGQELNATKRPSSVSSAL